MKTALGAFLLVLGTSLGLPQGNPPTASQGTHHHAVNERGDKAMGFSHEKATHHFSLYIDGARLK